ncbi:MAG: threonylcarbamoyl-AMP synthase [Nannocystis sp.]|nr:L-threonylcarbamoyladenylate synthase [Nannocystis sp.]MBA3549388.1 threonylcarbamoyl-AMP synthase [Nannocystis sp.]
MRLHIEAERPNPRKMQPAVDALKRGQVIIYPTDTGYAFGCALSSPKGIAAIRKLKGLDERSPKPLTMIVRDLAEVSRFAVMSNSQFRLIRRLLPGPYTLILKAAGDVPRSMHNRNHEVGIRMPDQTVCNLLLAELGEPLLTGSVTPYEDGVPELEEPESYEQRFSREVAVVIDVGPVWPDPSTVLRLIDDEVELLRQGKGEYTP